MIDVRLEAQPIGFATEGARFALYVNGNCGIRVQFKPGIG
jgi:hypothetical protein